MSEWFGIAHGDQAGDMASWENNVDGRDFSGTRFHDKLAISRLAVAPGIFQGYGKSVLVRLKLELPAQ